MKCLAAIGLGLMLVGAAGCQCCRRGVEHHPHEHVARQINDRDLLLDSLYCPDLDPLGIGTAPWFHRPFPELSAGNR